MLFRKEIIEIDGKKSGFICIDSEIPGEEKLYFNIKTYEKITKSSDFEFRLGMKPVHQLFNSFNTKENAKVFNMYKEIKLALVNNISIDFQNLIEGLSIKVYEYFNELNLIKRIEEIIHNSDISIPDLRNIGKRPQDTKEKTFFYDDYIQLTIISIMCKMFSPVFGEITFVFFKKDPVENIEKELKERLSLGIIKYVLQNNFSDLMYKLNNYIFDEVKRRKEMNLSGLFKGYTLNNLVNFVIAALFIKKFVNINLYREGGDMMTYILACIKFTLNSIMATIKKKTNIKARFTPTDNPSLFDSEDGKKSNLEVEGNAFKYTVDIPVMVRIGISKLINKNLKKMNINKKDFDECYNYYLNHIINITPFNRFVASVFFSKELGGAIGIQMIPAKVYIEIIVFLQFYMADLGLSDLLHALSITPTDLHKEEFSIIDNKIKISKGIGYEYRLCKDMFSFLDSIYNWNSYITKALFDFLIKRENHFNTAPYFWVKLNEENQNSNKFIYKETILNDVYEFIINALSMQ